MSENGINPRAGKVRRADPSTQMRAQATEVAISALREAPTQTPEAHMNLLESKHIRFVDTVPVAGLQSEDPNFPTVGAIEMYGKKYSMSDSDQQKEELQQIIARAPSSPDIHLPQGTQEEHMITSSHGRGTKKKNTMLVNGTTYNYLYLKGNCSYAALRETGHPFSRKDARFNLTRPTDRGHASGVLTRSEALLDAQNAKKLSLYGVRVRIPVRGYTYSSIQVDETTYTSDSFIKEFAQSKDSERPYLEIMAVRSGFSLEDVTSIIYEAMQTGNLSSLEHVVHDTIDCAQKDEDPLVQTIAKKNQHALEMSFLDNPDQMYKSLYAFFLLYTSLFAREFAKIHKAGFIHANPHTQNTSFLMDVSDLVTLSDIREHNKDRRYGEIAKELRSMRETVVNYSDKLQALQKRLGEMFPQKLESIQSVQQVTFEKLETLFLRSYEEVFPEIVVGQKSLAEVIIFLESYSTAP